MYNSIISLASSLIGEIKTAWRSDVKDLEYLFSKEYINKRQLSITITQKEYADYVNSKNL